MRKVIAMLMALAILGGGVGCATKRPANPNTPVVTPDTPQQKFERTIAGGLGFTDSLSLALNGVDKARKDMVAAGQMDAATSAKILAALKQVAAKNALAATACDLANRTGDPSVQWQDKVVEVIQAAKGIDPATFGVKNANSQAALQSAFNVLQIVVASAQSTFAPQGGTQ